MIIITYVLVVISIYTIDKKVMRRAAMQSIIEIIRILVFHAEEEDLKCILEFIKGYLKQ
jgi:hypothetical protein